MLNMRESWTDERLDDFASNVKQRFDRIERKMDEGFRELRGEMGGRLDSMDAQLHAMQRSMTQLAFVIIAALAGVIATQLGLILTQI